MVLDNSSDAAANDNFYDSAPPSDDDTYASSNSNAPTTAQYRIDRSTFPKPIPIISPLLAYNDKTFGKIFALKVQQSANVLKRPPTQEEAQALAYWTARQLSIISIGGPLGILGGAWRAYQTAPTFRFPFWQPDLEKFNPLNIGPIRGQRAFLIWHAGRFLAYGATGNVIASVLFGSYSMSVTTVGEITDPRLKDYVSEVRNQARASRGQLPPSQSSQAGQGGGPVKDRGSDDDASPTGGAYGDDFASESTDSFQRLEGAKYPSLDSPTRRPTQASTPRVAPPQETQSQAFDPFGDDASPTGGQGISEATSASRPQGSAWDRVRQGAVGSRRPRQQDATHREQREGSTAGDAFAFSKTDEERSYAKDEAQKEFDARVERERRGGDFSSGSGDQRRW